MKAIISILTLMALSSHGLYAQNARQIAENAANAVDFTSMEMAATLRIIDNRGNERIRQIANATRKFNETTKTLIRFLAPADVKGTAMLVYEYEEQPSDMWIYMPALRKTRRIISSEKGNSFMGSEFSNADMARPVLDNFTYRLLGTDIISGKTCWKLESVCINDELEDENGFSKKIAWIGQTGYLTLKVEYYDGDDDLFKIMLLNDYRKQENGKYFAFQMEVSNVQTGRKSILTIDKFQTGSGLDENSFAVAGLDE
ncbi:MAG: outer membrane lipoprotein-sorting protein [Bacteroidales bacterium]|nr:outer membrane lipoprotein-sorting protein [Bacteroidales bacterium]